jgi:hypothetical protein
MKMLIGVQLVFCHSPMSSGGGMSIMNSGADNEELGPVDPLRRLAALTVVAATLVGLHGCGLLTPSTIASLSTSVIGGLANGAIMGGSVIGTIRDKAVNAQKASPDATLAANNGEPIAGTAQ